MDYGVKKEERRASFEDWKEEYIGDLEGGFWISSYHSDTWSDALYPGPLSQPWLPPVLGTKSAPNWTLHHPYIVSRCFVYSIPIASASPLSQNLRSCQVLVKNVFFSPRELPFQSF